MNVIKTRNKICDTCKDKESCKYRAEQQRKHFYKCFGCEVTKEQIKNIRNGNFDGMNVGDFWVLGGIIFRIYDFDNSIVKSWVEEKEKEEKMKHHVTFNSQDLKKVEREKS